MQATQVQTVVVGAGVVGLAVAASLAKAGREVFVLEANAAIGQGVSSRNSEVIHAGIYYPPKSIKACVCVRGRHLLYEHCKQHHVTTRRIGKLIVATSTAEISALKNLYQRGIENGVDDLELIDRNTAMTMQPGLHCTAALHSPSTGIIDSHQFMLSLHAEIENNGSMVVCNAPVEKIVCKNNLFSITVAGDSAMLLHSREVINCTGLHAVALAKTITGLPKKTIPTAQFAQGNYFRLQGRTPFTKLIYPAPVSGGLGVHLTIDIGGQARFGPDVQWLDAESHNTLDPDVFSYRVDPKRADSFYAAIRTYWPDLPDNALQPDYAGVRPKIKAAESTGPDFNISTYAHHGIQGLVNLYCIESPGLTSSLAIAEMVTEALNNS